MANRDRLDGDLRIANEALSQPLRRLNRVLEHTNCASGSHAQRAKKLLEEARAELESAARLEDGCVCVDCQEYYELYEMETKSVPEWGGKRFYCCPHCGSHKREIE